MFLFNAYQTEGAYDEMFQPDGQPRPHYRDLYRCLSQMSLEEFRRRHHHANLTRQQQGITVVADNGETETATPAPFDLIPRIIPAEEWEPIERGLKQRVTALNLFLRDIYHDQKILNDHVVPRELVLGAARFRRAFQGVNPPDDIYVHLCAADLIRDTDGVYRVLDDHLSAPSGFASMIANRTVLAAILPQLFHDLPVRPIDHCTPQLLTNLRALAPPHSPPAPNVVLLTPGASHRIYPEHAFLAGLLGIALVEGRDLYIEDNLVSMQTTGGSQRVDVIYRGVEDDLVDPLLFRPDSSVGIPGLVNAYRAGNVALANSIGVGVAEDKVIYAFVPRIIQYYLNEEPILPNVQTYLASNPQHLSHILVNLDQLVIKRADGAGHGRLLIGPQASRAERESLIDRLKAEPRNYIAQSFVSLSCAPFCVEDHCESRPIDLRAYLLYGSNEITAVPGGLTRGALQRDSYLTDNPQGNGSKDTWALAKDLQAARASGSVAAANALRWQPVW